MMIRIASFLRLDITDLPEPAGADPVRRTASLPVLRAAP